jgi:hypothetical protein
MALRGLGARPGKVRGGMSRRSRNKARRRRKWTRRLKRGPTDRLNLALGEFMTALGRVEFTMLMVISLVSEAPIEHLFDEYAKLTFGKKIEWFETWARHERENFSDENWKRMEELFKELKGILPKRNSLIHGETYEESFPGEGKRAYRIGVEKNNLDYLEEFSRGKKKGTIFNVEQIQVATRECEGIRTKLNKVRGVEKPLW